MIALSTYLRQYKVGDIVDVVANGTEPARNTLGDMQRLTMGQVLSRRACRTRSTTERLALSTT